MTTLATIILAAGKGTRMQSDLPKVLHPVGGTPMLVHVLRAAQQLGPVRQVVITGHGAAEVEAVASQAGLPAVSFARQNQQLGTGHAVQQAAPELSDFSGDVMILMGDAPMVSPTQLSLLLHAHRTGQHHVTVGTAQAQDPTGLGRILRDAQGRLLAIVEQKDASPTEQKITEINAGLYVVAAPVLFALLSQVQNTNAQKEYYLTDIIRLGLQAGHRVGAVTLPGDPRALQGVNTPEQLALNEAFYQQRLQQV